MTGLTLTQTKLEMQVRNFLINLFRPNAPNYPVGVGDRVHTKYGNATIIGGAIHIRTDKVHNLPNGQSNNGFTINLEEVDVIK